MIFLKIVVFLLVFSLIPVSPVIAQTTSLSAELDESATEDVKIASDPGELEESESSSEYMLPYPGMLPNNPLYFLKSFRDTFIGFIISDPLKKAEFELLQADKKIAAAQFLLKEEENRGGLALQSVKESMIHTQTAFDKLVATDVKSTDSQAVFQKMAAALSKHQDVLEELSKSTDNDEFSSFVKPLSSLEEKVESYL